MAQQVRLRVRSQEYCGSFDMSGVESVSQGLFRDASAQPWGFNAISAIWYYEHAISWLQTKAHTIRCKTSVSASPGICLVGCSFPAVPHHSHHYRRRRRQQERRRRRRQRRRRPLRRPACRRRARRRTAWQRRPRCRAWAASCARARPRGWRRSACFRTSAWRRRWCRSAPRRCSR